MKNKNILLIFLFASAYIFGGSVILTYNAQSQSNINSEWVTTSAEWSQGNAQELSVEEKSIVAKNLLSTPLLFEKNASPTSVWREGQVDANVKFLARSAGEIWTVGSQRIITWDATNITNVKLEYTTNNGSSWILITPSWPARVLRQRSPSDDVVIPDQRNHTSNMMGGLFNWTIPNTPSLLCLVRVSDAADPNIFDISNGVFTISPAQPDTMRNWDLRSMVDGQLTFVSSENDAGNRGFQVAFEDVNGDGYGDVVIAGWSVSALGRSQCGAAYVFFGPRSLSSTLNLNTANVKIFGPAAGSLLQGLAVGDVNGDGKADIALGARGLDRVYLTLGSSSLPATIDLNITYTCLMSAPQGQYTGSTVSMGDVNADGKRDILIAAPGGDGPGGSRVDAGTYYLVYGRTTWPSSLDLSSQTVIHGAEAGDGVNSDGAYYPGMQIVAGDINHDGYDDILIGAPGADGPGNSRPDCGEAYAVFGGVSLPTVIDLATQANLTCYGVDPFDHVVRLGAGDVNGDGITDFLIGARDANGPNNTRPGAGEVYVVYGRTSFPSIIDLATSANVTIYGKDAGDIVGRMVAKDINGDGISELFLGAPGASGPNNSRSSSGEAYLLLGGTLPSVIDLAQYPHHTIYGADAGDALTAYGAMALGNIDRDFVTDLIIGAYAADGQNNGYPDDGEAYVVSGRALRLLAFQVLFPNGGETFYKQTPYTIKWSSTNYTGNVQIKLYKAGIPILPNPISDNAPNTGSYNFTPSCASETGTDYKILVAATGSGVPNDFSDGPFTITNRPTDDPCDQPSQFKLRFPLKGSSPYTHVITSIFDHSNPNSQSVYCPPNRKVIDCWGDSGVISYTQRRIPITCQELIYGYRKNTGEQPREFKGFKYYNDTVLYYDNHPGYDYRARLVDEKQKIGQQVFSAARGRVDYPKKFAGVTSGESVHAIAIQHLDNNNQPNGYVSYYLHMYTYKGINSPIAGDPPTPDSGAIVQSGQYIGRSGEKGSPREPHLHFELRYNGRPFDPYGWKHPTLTDPYLHHQNLPGGKAVDLWEDMSTAQNVNAILKQTNSNIYFRNAQSNKSNLNVIELEWVFNADSISYFEMVRYGSDGSTQTFIVPTTGLPYHNYIDNDIVNNVTYTYYVRAAFLNGTFSGASTPVVISTDISPLSTRTLFAFQNHTVPFSVDSSGLYQLSLSQTGQQVQYLSSKTNFTQRVDSIGFFIQWELIDPSGQRIDNSSHIVGNIIYTDTSQTFVLLTKENQTGLWNLILSGTENIPIGDSLVVTSQITSTSQSVYKVDREVVSFFNIPLGEIVSDSIEITNIGNAPLEISWNYSGSEKFQVSSDSGVIPPMQQYSIPVQFLSLDTSYVTGEIILQHNGITSPDTVLLIGKGGFYPPSIPELISPLNGSIDQPTTLTFLWEFLYDADKYHLQVAIDSNFTQVIFEDSTITDNSKQLENLANNTIHYWRVHAVNVGGHSGLSETWNFKTIIQLPEQILLVTPLDSAILGADSCVFVWNKGKPETEKYWFELSEDSLFTHSVIDSILIDTTTIKRQLNNNKKYWWRVKAWNAAGWGGFSAIRHFTVIIVSVNDIAELPKEYALEQNYPNPFNPITILRYQLPTNSRVTLKIYNVLGQEVKTLANEIQDAGCKSIEWNSTNNFGNPIASGIYFYRLEATSIADPSKTFTQVRKMLLLR